MNFSRGRTRFVLAFPRLGFVIKFPIVKLTEVLSDIRINIKRRSFGVIRIFFKSKIDNDFGYKNKLFYGIWSNWLEFYLWVKTRNALLHPTYFSFFGLFNIQKYGKPLTYEEGDEVGMVVARLSNDENQFCGHGFERPDNYTFVNGKLRMIDYGGRRLWPVILKYGHEIAQAKVEDCRRKN